MSRNVDISHGLIRVKEIWSRSLKLTLVQVTQDRIVMQNQTNSYWLGMA